MSVVELHGLQGGALDLMKLKKSMTSSLLNHGRVDPCFPSFIQFHELDLNAKYGLIALGTMLSSNCMSREDVDKVTGALVVLGKYAFNLLQLPSLRPVGWNVIDFANPIFREKVHNVKGTQAVLIKLGYVHSQAGSLTFPLLVQPNRDIIAEIYMELIAGHHELTIYLKQAHHCPSFIEKYLPFATRHENEMTMAKVLDTAVNEDFQINLVEESEPRNGNVEPEVLKEMGEDNIPIMVLEQMVSFPPTEDVAAVEFITGEKCDICGKAVAIFICRLCDNKNLCEQCDGIWHKHPKRRDHKRTPISDKNSHVATTEVETVKKKVANEVQTVRPTADLKQKLPFSTLPATPLRMVYSGPSVSSSPFSPAANSSSKSYLISQTKCVPSSVAPPLIPHAWPISKVASEPQILANGNDDNDDDDFKALLSKARHPPPIYTPPVPTEALGLLNNELIKAGHNFAMTMAASTYLPVSTVKNPLPTEFSNVYFTPASKHNNLVANTSVVGKFSQLTMPAIVANKERTYDRSASSSGILAGGARGTDNTAIREAKNLRWNCQHCTFANSVLPGQKSRICTMCYRTDTAFQIVAIDDKNDDTLVKVPVTSSQLVRAASAFEPLGAHSRDSSRSTNGSSQFVSKFVEIQDEIYREKKIALERFQREQSQSEAAIPNSLSTEGVQKVESHLQKLAITASTLHPSTRAPSTNLASRNSSEYLDPVTPVAHNEGLGAAASYTINRKHYNSSFVDLADQIYMEKKAAQEEFRRMESETASKKSLNLKHYDVVEFKRAATTVAQGQGAALYPNPKQSTVRESIANENPAFSRMKEIEEIEREKRIQDMKTDGLTLLRLVKAVESENRYSDAEVNAVLSICGTNDPYLFYQDVWSQLIGKVVEKLREQSVISRQSFPLELVSVSLERSRGVIESAVEIFKDLWSQRVNIILRDCGLSDRRKVVSILDDNGGDTEAAKTVVIREKFHEHIWSDGRQPGTNADIGADDDIYHRATRHLNSDLSVILTDNALSRERRTRMILAETHLPGWQRAENVLTILEESNLLSSAPVLLDIVDAVKNCGTVEESRQFLQQQCEICFDCFPSRLIKSMGCCQCKICSTCIGQYFEVVIRERFVRNLVCPVCSLPEIDTASEQTETHFQFLLLMLRNMVANETYELFQMKLRDWNLMMDPSFRWCASTNCKSGFLIDPEQLQNRIACPHCQSLMCQQCKKPWEDQHNGLTCEQFQSWKENNDPEVQALGLARHLEENGIECPRCKCRYSLAKGGCMHFTCIQCRHEFCSGCLQPFRRGQNCALLRGCAKAGLHCHHPRDCLFYLRDRDVTELQQLLQDNNVHYDTESSQTRILDGPDGERCSVMEQKQTQNGFKDEACGKEVPQNFAGLCEIHYKEYLVGLINKNNIDPAKIMNRDELIVQLKRVEKKVPNKKRNETDEQYQETLLRMVQEQLPLSQRHNRQIAEQTNAVDQLGAALDHRVDVTDGQENTYLRFYGEELIGRGARQNYHTTLMAAFGNPSNHARIPRVVKDSGYSSPN